MEPTDRLQFKLSESFIVIRTIEIKYLFAAHAVIFMDVVMQFNRIANFMTQRKFYVPSNVNRQYFCNRTEGRPCFFSVVCKYLIPKCFPGEKRVIET